MSYSEQWVEDLAEVLDAPPVIDAPSVNRAAAQAPPVVKTPPAPEPVMEVMDVAFEVLDALTTPNT